MNKKSNQIQNDRMEQMYKYLNTQKILINVATSQKC